MIDYIGLWNPVAFMTRFTHFQSMKKHKTSYELSLNAADSKTSFRFSSLHHVSRALFCSFAISFWASFAFNRKNFFCHENVKWKSNWWVLVLWMFMKCRLRKYLDFDFYNRRCKLQVRKKKNLQLFSRSKDERTS